MLEGIELFSQDCLEHKRWRIKRFKDKEQWDTDGSQGTLGRDSDLHKWLNILE